jgi:hypothetical protein
LGKNLTMASKTPATKSPSKDRKRTSSGTSRKIIRKTTAAYARRADDDEDDKGKKSTGGEAESQARSEAESEAGSQAESEAGSQAEAPPDAPAEAAQPAAGTTEAAAPATPSAPAQDSAGAPEMHQAPERTLEAPVIPDEEPGAAEAVQAPEPTLDAPGDAPLAAAPQASLPAAESEFAELLPPDAVRVRDPDSPAPPPGKAPPGDSRSLRRHHEGAEEFVLIYRHESYLITRAGKVGTQGTWTMVEYPHIGAAAHAYAQECSKLTGAGYRDLC